MILLIKSKNIFKRKKDTPQTNNNLELICSICLFPLLKDEDKVTTPCKHLYHRNCICEWIDRTILYNPTCPLCRSNLITKDGFLYVY